MDELKMGQVKIVASNNGNDIDEIEMLLLPKAKLKLSYDKINKTVNMNVSDTNILTDSLDGILDLPTLNDLIQALIRVRNRIQKEENLK